MERSDKVRRKCIQSLLVANYEKDKTVKNTRDITLESNKTCSGFQSKSISSGPFELFQLSVLFLLAG